MPRTTTDASAALRLTRTVEDADALDGVVERVRPRVVAALVTA